MPDSRAEILALLHGTRLGRLPVFGVLPSLTASGLHRSGVKYSAAHTDPEKMAKAAASTFEWFGWESAVVPFDICVEAEALGCRVDFQADTELFLAPTVQSPIGDLVIPKRLGGHIPLVAEAIGTLKRQVGRQVLVGAWIPGPFTLAWQAFGADTWLSSVGEGSADEAIGKLGEYLGAVGNLYSNAGADFVTVHEMGGSPQVIGPQKFRSLVKPALVKLLAKLPRPHILSICGDTDAIVHDLAECRPNAINVDHRNDLARTRRELPEVVLLGNYDPVGELRSGSIQDVAHLVERIALDGADALVPGCDLYPDIPEENFRTLVEKGESWRKHS